MKKLFVLIMIGIALPCRAVPHLVNYQGYLTDPDGTPLDTVVSMTFTLYDAASSGMQLWMETQNPCTVRAGLFNVQLGSVTAVPDSFQNSEVWLGVAVGSNSEMVPRSRLTSIPYAYRVGTVSGASGGDITGDVNVTGRGNFGTGNVNSGAISFVTGQNNCVRGAYAVVAGGGGPSPADSNSARGSWSVIGGGAANNADSLYSVISGGHANRATAYYAAVGGGDQNRATGNYSTANGGYNNTASGGFTSIGGGSQNSATSYGSTVGGGSSNSSSGNNATVGGGSSNSASGFWATVPGGTQNAANGNYSLAAGRMARANYSGSLVWGDATADTIADSSANEMRMRASGGTWIYSDSLLTEGVVLRPGANCWTPIDASDPCTLGSGQLYADTNAYDATRSWVQSNGYLRGTNNVVSATGFVGGGDNNFARGDYSVIGGGGGAVAFWDSNSATGNSSFIGGGSLNNAHGAYAVISGGNSNTASGGGAAVGGGYGNTASGSSANVGGGSSNTASGLGATVGGGILNTASGSSATVCGGAYNRARGSYSTIGGGGGDPADSNSAIGDYSTVPGGTANAASGRYSFAAGRRAKANHGGTFVWADTTNADFSSITTNQFLIRAAGGVGIGLNNPSEQLEVNGDVRADTVLVDRAVRFPDGTLQLTAPAAVTPSGWTDDGTKVRLTAVTDSVGIGTSAPKERLDVSGNLLVNGKANIGSGNVNSGLYAFVAGRNDTASGDYSTVNGGYLNKAGDQYATVGGGYSNAASGHRSTVGGGDGNSASAGYSVVGGGGNNVASYGYATIGGGVNNQATQLYATVGGGIANKALGERAVVSGGSNNSASGIYSFVGGGSSGGARGDYSVVCGGGGNLVADSNAAIGLSSSVGGGARNRAEANYSTIPGGMWNAARGENSFAAGYRAVATHTRSFVWASSMSVGDSTTSFGDYTFTARTPGGARFYTTHTTTASGVSLSAGGGSWNNLCDVRRKNLHGRVNTADVLKRVAELPLQRWSYKAQDESIQHIGPTAQDFYASFGLGESDTTISTLDPDGVALAAIQELAKQNKSLEAELATLRAQVQSLMAEQQKALKEGK